MKDQENLQINFSVPFFSDPDFGAYIWKGPIKMSN
jgi:hypothetical protein